MSEKTLDNSESISNLLSLYSLRLTSLDDKILKLLTILSPLEPHKRHQDVKLPRSKNAGKWLLDLESFQKWQDARNAIEENGGVFCGYGIPGAGKTVMRYGVKSPVGV